MGHCAKMETPTRQHTSARCCPDWIQHGTAQRAMCHVQLLEGGARTVRVCRRLING